LHRALEQLLGHALLDPEPVDHELVGRSKKPVVAPFAVYKPGSKGHREDLGKPPELWNLEVQFLLGILGELFFRNSFRNRGVLDLGLRMNLVVRNPGFLEVDRSLACRSRNLFFRPFSGFLI
jgi:hypothetical protein